MSQLGPLLNGNDCAVEPDLLALPINDCRFAEFASVKEHMDRHRKDHATHADVHSSVPTFVFGNLFQEARQNFVQFSHSPTPAATERPGSRPHMAFLLNELTDVNDEPFLGFRQTVESVAKMGRIA